MFGLAPVNWIVEVPAVSVKLALEESHAPATKCVRPAPQLHVPCVSVNRLVTVSPAVELTVTPPALLLIVRL